MSTFGTSGRNLVSHRSEGRERESKDRGRSLDRQYKDDMYCKSTGDSNLAPSTDLDIVSLQLLENERYKVRPKTGGAKTRDRISYSSEQLQRLHDAFEKAKYPSNEDFEKLSSVVGLPIKNLKVWFQNARARAKKSGGGKTTNPVAGDEQVLENNNTSNDSEDSIRTIPNSEPVWGLRLPVLLPEEHWKRCETDEDCHQENTYSEQCSERISHVSPTYHPELNCYSPSKMYPYHNSNFSDHLYNGNNAIHQWLTHVKQEVSPDEIESTYSSQAIRRTFTLSNTMSEQTVYNSPHSPNESEEDL